MQMSRIVAVCVLMLLAAVAGPLAAEELSRVPVQRGESLELPGLTAGCHVCEWRPKFSQMPSADECGTDASGAAKVGLFECGFSENCQRECHFLRCGTL
jgi:hypothetical protein